ncbi:hypothetical protein OS493_029483 [Desmophyllum pertusum]|uniref:Uncharacterized protein n=1 Tax=Desmophyllum pertusum TaxID=174260 RepID=A0A9W9Y8U3_9CNID|nr:hypothetical protein OS493_029483 [Desmophyllum pertusum]
MMSLSVAETGPHLTPSLAADRIASSVVRKVDSFHEKIRQTFGAVTARVKWRHKHEQDGRYEADWQSEKKQDDQPDYTP